MSDRSRRPRVSLPLALSLSLSCLLLATGTKAQLPDVPPDRIVAARDRAFDVADSYPEAEDLEALAEELDFEPEAAFAFVRDEVRFDPYEGSLRGWPGVLATRSGNAYEKALLLVELLEHMGYDARLVVGELAPDKAGRLTEAALDAVETPSYEPLGELCGLGDQTRARILETALRDQRLLSSVVSTRGASERAGQARDHYWVQADLDGDWIDLDPTWPDAQAGEKMGEVKRLSGSPLSELDHLVTVRVLAETLEKGELTEQTLLSRELVAREAARDQVFLWFAPREAPAAAVDNLRRLVQPGGEFLPVLSINGDLEKGDPAPGVAPPKSDRSAAQEFLSGGSNQAELAAIYLDVEVRTPSGQTQIERRILLDRVAPAARAGTTVDRKALGAVEAGVALPLALEGAHQIVIETGGLGAAEMASTLGVSLAFANVHFHNEESFRELSLSDALWPMGNFHLSWLAAGQDLVLSNLNDRRDRRFFVGRPHVTLFSSRPIPAGEGLTVTSEIDFLHDSIDVVAAEDAEPGEVASGRTRYGVLRSALETVSGQDRARLLEGSTEGVVSASTQLARPLVVLDADDLDRLVRDAPRALREDLENGHRVVLSESHHDQPETWWAFDPALGSIKARLAPGLGGRRVMGRKIYHGGGNWGGSSGSRTYTIDVDTMNVIEEHDARGRKIKRRAANQPQKHRRGKGGSEYLILLENVSIPAGMSVAAAYGWLISEVVVVVLLNIYTMS